MAKTEGVMGRWWRGYQKLRVDGKCSKMTREGGEEEVRKDIFKKISRNNKQCKERQEKKQESIVFWNMSELLGKKRISASI